MPTLVTGASGFVGRHAVADLAAHRHDVVALDLAFPSPVPGASQHIAADICSAEAVTSAVADLRPDACLHLAAMTFVPEGHKHPARMFQVNLMGTLNLLQALRECAPRCPCLVVSSGQVYGNAPRNQAVTESDPFAPSHPYAASKAAADVLAASYALGYGLPTLIARPHNHIGPGQPPQVVVASLAAQVRAAAADPAAPPLRAGNLDSRRDFCDVRDVVRAYRLLLEKGQPGRAYNIASGRLHTIRDVLETLCDIAGARPDIVVDPALYRPADTPPMLDTSRILAETGWTPRIPLRQTLQDMLACP